MSLALSTMNNITVYTSYCTFRNPRSQKVPVVVEGSFIMTYPQTDYQSSIVIVSISKAMVSFLKLCNRVCVWIDTAHICTEPRDNLHGKLEQPSHSIGVEIGCNSNLWQLICDTFGSSDSAPNVITLAVQNPSGLCPHSHHLVAEPHLISPSELCTQIMPIIGTTRRFNTNTVHVPITLISCLTSPMCDN